MLGKTCFIWWTRKTLAAVVRVPPIPASSKGQICWVRCVVITTAAFEENPQVRSRSELLILIIRLPCSRGISPNWHFKNTKRKKPPGGGGTTETAVAGPTHTADAWLTGLCQSAEADQSQAVAAVASTTTIPLAQKQQRGKVSS